MIFKGFRKFVRNDSYSRRLVLAMVTFPFFMLLYLNIPLLSVRIMVLWVLYLQVFENVFRPVPKDSLPEGYKVIWRSRQGKEAGLPPGSFELFVSRIFHHSTTRTR